MRVIITGGTGLIGRALAQALVLRGDEAIILSRDPGRVTGFPETVQVMGWDGQTSGGWGSLVDASTAIVNLAGESIAAGRWTAERKQRIRDSRLNAGKAVEQAVRAAPDKPRVVIQSSAVGYYGPRDDQPVAEDSAPGDDFLAQVCVDWEDSTRPVGDVGVRRAIIRTGVVLSTSAGALPRMLLPFRFFVGGPLGNGRQVLPWIHLDDEIAAIQFLIDREDASGPFNLTAPKPVTNAEFSQSLGHVMGRPAVVPTPAFALRLAFGEMATIVLDGQRAIPQRLGELGYPFHYPDPESALRALLA